MSLLKYEFVCLNMTELELNGGKFSQHYTSLNIQVRIPHSQCHDDTHYNECVTS